jgi:hypothetical protein
MDVGWILSVFKSATNSCLFCYKRVSEVLQQFQPFDTYTYSDATNIFLRWSNFGLSWSKNIVV